MARIVIKAQDNRMPSTCRQCAVLTIAVRRRRRRLTLLCRTRVVDDVATSSIDYGSLPYARAVLPLLTI